MSIVKCTQCGSITNTGYGPKCPRCNAELPAPLEGNREFWKTQLPQILNPRHAAFIAVAAGIAIMIYVGFSWRQAQNEKREADKLARFESATVAGEEDQIRPWLKMLPVKFQVEPPKLDEIKPKLNEWVKDQSSSDVRSSTGVDTGSTKSGYVLPQSDPAWQSPGLRGPSGVPYAVEERIKEIRSRGGIVPDEVKIYEDRHQEFVRQKTIKEAKILDIIYAKDPHGGLVCFIRYELTLGVYIRKTAYTGARRSVRLDGPEPGDVRLGDEIAVANAKLFWGQTRWSLWNVNISDDEKESELASYKIQSSAKIAP